MDEFHEQMTAYNLKERKLFSLNAEFFGFVGFVAILIALIATMLFTVHSIISYQENSARYINVSGQQRMLSQRLALFSLRYLESKDENDRRIAQEALNKIERNLNTLLDQHLEDIMLSETLSKMYYEEPVSVKNSVINYMSAVSKIINTPPDSLENVDLSSEKDHILQNVTPLLIKLDSVVQQYEQEAQERVDSLKQIENFILVSFVMITGFFLYYWVIPWFKKTKLKHAELHSAASNDHLTKLLNRKALDDISGELFLHHQTSGEVFAALMIDIDHFKQVNDVYGHLIGDRILAEIAQVIKENVRDHDYCFRYGGEELLVILPQTDSDKARHVADKIRSMIKSKSFTANNKEITISVSIGVSSLEKNDVNVNDLIERVDIAMYRAKKGGRDCIVRF